MCRGLHDSTFHSGLEAERPGRVQLRFSFAGYDSAKPNVIVKLEQGEEPWVAEGDLPCGSRPGELVEWSPDLRERLEVSLCLGCPKPRRWGPRQHCLSSTGAQAASLASHLMYLCGDAPG